MKLGIEVLDDSVRMSSLLLAIGYWLLVAPSWRAVPVFHRVILVGE
jgi:hypothetical protein